MCVSTEHSVHWSFERNFLISSQHSSEFPSQQVAKLFFITLQFPVVEVQTSSGNFTFTFQGFTFQGSREEDCGRENETKQHIFFDCWKCECNEMIVFIILQESSPPWLVEPWEKRFFSRLGNKTNVVRLPNLHFLLAYIFHNKLREEWLERSGKSCDLLTAIARRCFSQPSREIYSQILFESTEIIVKVNE